MPSASVSARPEFLRVIDDPLFENFGVIGKFRGSKLFLCLITFYLSANVSLKNVPGRLQIRWMLVSRHIKQRSFFLAAVFVCVRNNEQTNCQCVRNQFIASKTQETHSRGNTASAK